MPHNRVLITDFEWHGIAARVTVTPNHRIDGWTLITIALKNPSGPPLPIIPQGTIIHHGIEQEKLDAAGGVLPFLTCWADRDAQTPGYLKALAAWRQGDLFSAE